MDPSTTSAIRDVFVIVAAGLLAALCLILIAVFFKLYRPIRETILNSSRASENLMRVSTDLASVSEETANNLAKSSSNLAYISEKAREGSEGLSAAIHSVGEAANSVGSAATTATRVTEMISRLIPEASGGSASGVGALLRLVRNVFAVRKTGEGKGTERDS